MTIRLFLAALAAVSFSSVLAEDRQKCGPSATYFPSEYTCYDNKTLCPKVYGLSTRPCAGSGGCYPPEQFSCSSSSNSSSGEGTLSDLPEATSPFTLRTWSVRPTWQNQTVRACGGYLAIGANARECHACTAAGGRNCENYKNATVLLPEGRMNAAIPHGQYWFVNPRNGLLQYTPAVNLTATNTSSPTIGNTTVEPEIPNKEFAALNVKVYENGFFVWDKTEGVGSGSHFWYACLVTLPGGAVSTGRSWRIYAPIIDRSDCEQVRIVARAADKSQGVWRYT